MEYLSLYDYLGKPAGGKLGKEVASAASREGIKLETRKVDTPRYTGIVYLYPKDFLEFYFREPEVEPTPVNKITQTAVEDLFGSNEDLDDLPF
jgi:hypothetical protein